MHPHSALPRSTLTRSGLPGPALAAAPPRATGLAWKLNRLRCMTLAEIMHRIGRACRIHAEHFGLIGGLPAPPPDFSATARTWIRPPAVDPAPYVAAAERLLAGRLDVFALADVQFADVHNSLPPAWNRDPKTGIEAPLDFGKLLDYRDEARVGDIKYLWEPNRHLQLVTLAQAYRLSGDPRYATGLGRQLQSWFAACPPGRGANWSSALEAGLRLINWAIAWQLVGGASAPLFADAAGQLLRRRWLDSVHAHAEFIAGHLSLHSSANNHLLGEVAGLYVAMLTWPYWPHSPQVRGWKRTARALLEREALRQNAADGVNREQAVGYQQFVLDLLLLPWLAARADAAEPDFPPAYGERIERMLDYLASIMDRGGNLPMFGDADDGAVVRLAPAAGFCPYRSLLATGALLFRRGEFKAKAGALDDKTRWLLAGRCEQIEKVVNNGADNGAGKGGHEAGGEAGGRIDAAYAALPAAGPLPVRHEFPEGGYYILGRDFEGPDEIRLVADAGPLGYLGIAAHGHADALSFTLSLGGCEFLVDPGTYAYHTDGEWRAYFRGTAAHNTLRVDGLDQSQPGGNFLWLAKARASGALVADADGGSDCFAGRHDGYQRLHDPVGHCRRITLTKETGRIVIEDILQMRGEHLVELFFHFAEACRVEPTADGVIAERDGHCLRLRLPRTALSRQDLFCGSTRPIAGWVSRRFDRKTPAPTLRWQARLCGDTVLRSEIACDAT